jgi:hypothetical protein
VTTETTASATPTAVLNPVIGQRAAVQVLADLIDEHPGLPAAYTILHEPYPNGGLQVNLQVADHEFEAWREALGIEPADVELHTTVSHTWVAADTTRDGVRIHLAGFTNALTVEQANAPREVSA